MWEDIITFPPQSPDNPLIMQLAGTSLCDGTYRIARVNSPTCVFEYVVRGSGYYRLEDTWFYPSAGDVYIVPQGSDHEYGSSSDNPWTKLWFNVGGPLVNSLLEDYRLTGIHHLKDCPVRDVFEDGLAQLRENRADVESLAPHVILNVIMAIRREYHAALHRPYSEEGLILRGVIEQNIFKRSLPLAEISAAIRRSPTQAIRIFQRDFGVTPYQYQLRRKMETARILLKNSVKPIKEIAYDLGFADEYYFSNIFKNKNGMSPQKYRKEG